MRKRMNRKGFTMAELLIVVAIIVVLAGVAFISVQQHQKSMTQLEFDTIAKEIFVAAQNHLTMAESQGYPGLSDDIEDRETNGEYGHPDESSDETKKLKIYYYCVNGGRADAGKMFDLMLPFGSVDETVRVGSYVIRYQPSSATVLDVFYSTPDKTNMLSAKGTTLTSNDYDSLMPLRGDENKEARKSYKDNAVIGWFGDGDAVPFGERLEAPVLTVRNKEKLWVEVTDNNTAADGYSLVLLVTGKTSGAQHKFTLGSDSENRVVVNKKVILDDITASNMRFAALGGQTRNGDGSIIEFIPGEDIYVEAVAFNNKQRTNVAYSGKQTTNSLFQSIDMKLMSGDTDPVAVAKIENFRHLENLGLTISGFDSANCFTVDGSTLKPVTHAEQIKDLVWSGTDSFQSRISELNNAGIGYVSPGKAFPNSESISVYSYTNDASKSGCCLPVDTKTKDASNNDVSYRLVYNGKEKSIKNVAVDTEGNAGLFGTMSDAEISDLKLIDFSVITSSGSAGALAGTITGTATISNIIAYHTASFASNISAAGTGENAGSAGGLIGKLSGGTVSYSAAALIVNSSAGNAGGLIGTASGDVIGCYSGGHTEQGAYASYNVTAPGGIAGGLIGDAGDSDISYCYSTCSANGATVGGFIGKTDGGNIEECYCTGKVGINSVDNAFVHNAVNDGSGTPTTSFTDNHFFMIINEDPNGTTVRYKEAGATNNVSAETFDSTADKYNEFVGYPSDWKTAAPYDDDLKTYYNGKYNLKTVEQLADEDWSGTDKKDYYVRTHYGDWPAPEIFIFNSPAGS